MGKDESSFASQSYQDAQSPCLDDDAANSVKGQTTAVNGVGLSRVSHSIEQAVHQLHLSREAMDQANGVKDSK